MLGRGTTPIVILQHAPELATPEPRAAGLFHTAILFETQARPRRGRLLASARSIPGTFTGSADHLVSQAFYFTDPEGNGIELYWDRDRHRVELDPRPGRDGHPLPRPERRYLPSTSPRPAMADTRRSAAPWSATCTSRSATSPAPATFYVDKLGFETTAELGAAARCSSRPAATTTTWP